MTSAELERYSVEGVVLDPLESYDLVYFCRKMEELGLDPKQAQQEYLDRQEELMGYVRPALKEEYSTRFPVKVTIFLGLCILAAAFRKSKDEFSQTQAEINRLNQLKKIDPYHPEVWSLGGSTLTNLDRSSREKRNAPISAIQVLGGSYCFNIDFPRINPITGFPQSNYDISLRIDGDPTGEQLLENFGNLATTSSILERSQYIPSEVLVGIVRRQTVK